LTYDPVREQWTGDANRAAVEAEIKASPCFPLLKEIFSKRPSAGAPPATPLITSAVGWWPQLRNNDVGQVEVEN
jgi:hypothetical protein